MSSTRKKRRGRKTQTDRLGNCYQVAVHELLGPSLMHDTQLVTRTLCHGTPRLGIPPYKRYGHAWVESDSHVWHPQADDNVIVMPRCLYYAAGELNDDDVIIHRYSAAEVRQKLATTGVYGPWDDLGDAL